MSETETELPTNRAAWESTLRGFLLQRANDRAKASNAVVHRVTRTRDGKIHRTTSR